MSKKKLSKHTLPLRYKLEAYKIEGYLGEGGFSVTYLARHINLQQLVAIKEYFPTQCATRGQGHNIMPKESQEDDYNWGLERFLKEAKTLVLFKHENITRVRDFFEANGTAYMVMDYERGETFKEWLMRLKKIHKIPTEKELLKIIIPILDALDTLHKKQHLHLDIKPANIYICEDGRPMLIDFGTARQAFGDKSRSIRSVLSEGYAPKEQYSSRGNIDTWTDIYALSATLYCAITGYPPPPSPDRGEARDDGLADPLPSALDLEQTIYSVPFLIAIDAGLAYLPKERPQTVTEFTKILLNKSNFTLKNYKKIANKKNSHHLIDKQIHHEGTTVLFDKDKQKLALNNNIIAEQKTVFSSIVKIIILGSITIIAMVEAWWLANNMNLLTNDNAITQGEQKIITPPIKGNVNIQGNEEIIKVEVNKESLEEKRRKELRQKSLERINKIENDAFFYHLAKVNKSEKSYQAYLDKCQVCDKKKEIARALLLVKKYQQGDKWVEKNTKMKFSWIPSGSFKIGSIKSNTEADERNGSKLDIEGFFVGITEVTVGQFRKFVEATAYQTSQGDGCSSPDSWDRDKSGYQRKERYPVSCVSWNDAQAYIKWLNSLGKEKFALPSEAQWEYACRAGEIRTYCGANSYPKYAWGVKNSRNRTQPVAKKEANGLGIFDMSGNVHEWTGSKYNPRYNGFNEMQSLTIADNNDILVVRGGSFKSSERSLRATARGKIPKATITSYDDVGFRLVIINEP